MLKFKTPKALSKWRDEAVAAGTISKQLSLRATYVIRQWENIRALERRKITIDARTWRFFRADCDLLDEAMKAAGFAVVPFKRKGK